jgi:plasmid stabilization system protein ParE
MTRRLIVRPEAEADITKATIWYEDREQGLGQEVLSEIRAAVSRALENPEAFTR